MKMYDRIVNCFDMSSAAAQPHKSHLESCNRGESVRVGDFASERAWKGKNEQVHLILVAKCAHAKCQHRKHHLTEWMSLLSRHMQPDYGKCANSTFCHCKRVRKMWCTEINSITYKIITYTSNIGNGKFTEHQIDNRNVNHSSWKFRSLDRSVKIQHTCKLW